MTQRDRYNSFSDLARDAREGHDYRRLAERRGSGVAIIAPHGGGIEPGTSEIAAALAGREFALYCFEGLRPSGNDELHVTSHCFDDPACVQLVEDARVILAVHGCAGEHQAVYVGGLDRDLQARLIEALRRAGFDARPGASDRAGCYTSNICNRGSTGRGVQLELTRGLRLGMFKGFKWHERQITTPVFDRFVATIRLCLTGTVRDSLTGTIKDRQFATVQHETGSTT
jgi:phage replication-related protein YjqB (UPF0714/DUF867 family)